MQTFYSGICNVPFYIELMLLKDKIVYFCNGDKHHCFLILTLIYPTMLIYIPYHIHGHGVHSPFAFRFIHDVVDCTYSYYAFRDLWRKAVSSGNNFWCKKELELLFRMVQYYQPHQAIVPNSSPRSPLVAYLRASDSRMPIHTDFTQKNVPTLMVIEDVRRMENLPEEMFHPAAGSILVMRDANNPMWSKVISSATWSLSVRFRHVGVAFHYPEVSRGHYFCAL